MKHCYINGLGCVSTQETSDYSVFLEKNKELSESVVHVVKPNYRDYIKPAMIRRMANGVKYGVVAASMALKEAEIKTPQAIVTGTGLGCVIDSDKFLKNIIDNKEQFLTPTSFIQSTHNTVGGQIALSLQCKSYNVTYVHNATSFETTLIDAMLLINEGEENVLVGGVDEIGEYTTDLQKLIGHVKDTNTFSKGILKSNSKGAVYAEGAQFFALESKHTENSYAEIVDVTIYDILNEDDVSEKLVQFLKLNGLTMANIDIVVLGNNGDIDYDYFYTDLQSTILKETQQLYYKHLSGEYNTASSFGLWIASQICKSQEVPSFLKLNNQKVKSINYILLYNQYRGESHSFTLVKSC